jgi:COMPASS component SWD3
MKTLHAHLDFVTAVNFNRDATLIVSCALDGLMCARHSWPLKQKTLTQYTQVEYGTHPQLNVSKRWQKGKTPYGMSQQQCDRKSLSMSPQPTSQHVQFSPNSKYILSTAHDSAIRLWDYHTSRCLKTYTGHTNAKYCIAACFSVTGGKWIVSGSEDNKVYLWDLQSREIVQILDAHQGSSLYSAAMAYT